MKTELLIQMDGVRTPSANVSTGLPPRSGANNNTTQQSGQQPSQQVFVMAASNLPWDLDVAVLRRLEKRVLVSLPQHQARLMMFQKFLSDRVSEGLLFDEV
jgi:SpoVK/Ycf46/Vps4 family AAA+-type ATPase